MVGDCLRVLAVLLAAAAAIVAYCAMCLRLDSSDELSEIEGLDVDLGAAFALAVVLLFAPSRLKAPLAWVLTLIGAALIWLCVSGSLIWWHREQDRIRSG